MRSVKIQVTGKVQGVFFRQGALNEARLLGLRASAENCGDGSVCVRAEGKDQTIDALIAWCKKGPPMARVDQVTISEE